MTILFQDLLTFSVVIREPRHNLRVIIAQVKIFNVFKNYDTTDKKSSNTMQWRDLASYTFMLAGKIEILVNLHNTYVSPILIYNAI